MNEQQEALEDMRGVFLDRPSDDQWYAMTEAQREAWRRLAGSSGDNPRQVLEGRLYAAIHAIEERGGVVAESVDTGAVIVEWDDPGEEGE